MLVLKSAANVMKYSAVALKCAAKMLVLKIAVNVMKCAAEPFYFIIYYFILI